MTEVRGLRVALAGAALATMLVAGGSFATNVAGAWSSPKLTVVPVKGLKNHSTVKVSGSGFTPGDSLYVVQCIWKAPGAAGCSIASATPVTASSTGTFSGLKFKVVTGKIGNGKCGTKKSNLSNCEVSAGNASGGDSAVARITFVLPKG